MRLLLVFLLLRLTIPCVQSQDSSTSLPPPLSLEEKQRILGQLINYVELLKKNSKSEAELSAIRSDLRKFLDEERGNRDGLEGVSVEQLNICRAQTAEVEKQLEFYRNAYQVCMQAGKRSKSCWVKKFVSLWLWRCK
jgi:hypothetical protein